MENSSGIIQTLTALILFGGLTAALEAGFRSGQRVRRQHAEPADQLATVQAAILGLLALLLGFSFALAAGRFSARNQLILDEANAIGTAWLRCDLLSTNDRREVRDLLRHYAAERVVLYDATQKTAIVESEALQARIWKVVADAAKIKLDLANVLLPPFNELIDLHGSRVAAAHRHMPGMLVLLLLVCSVVAVGAVGYGFGVAGKRNVILTSALAFLIAAVLWAIIDFDHPRRGLIRADQQPMLDLQKSLKPN